MIENFLPALSTKSRGPLMFQLVLVLIAIPLGLDLYMPVPEDNPITKKKVALGRRLFFDRRLSRDGSIACATCHDPNRAFSIASMVASNSLKVG